MPKKQARPRKFALIALLVLVAVFFHISGWLDPVYKPLAGLLLRVSGPFHSAGRGLVRIAGGDGGRDEADPEALRRTIEDLRAENAKLLTLASENEALRAALSFKELGQDETVPARVVFETIDDEARLLVLDKGADDGLSAGQPVVAANGTVVGKVFEVRARTATVMPLSDSRSRLAVAVLNSPETLGVLEGDRGLSMSITLIPQDDIVSPGDTVVTSGLEPGIRRGLIVGTVDRVNKSTQNPFQSAGVTGFPSAAHPLLVQILVGGAEE